MKFEKAKRYGVANLRRLEKAGDSAALLAALRSPEVTKSPGLQTAAIKGLRNIGAPDAAPEISEVLVSDSPDAVRRSAARALGPLGNPVALPALRLAVDDSSKQVQMWAMRSLGELRDRQCLDVLMKRLEDNDAGVRGYAVRALGEIGDQRAAGPICELLEDPVRTVRLSAINALVCLRNPDAVAVLKSAVEGASLLRRSSYSDGLRRLEESLP